MKDIIPDMLYNKIFRIIKSNDIYNKDSDISHMADEILQCLPIKEHFDFKKEMKELHYLRFFFENCDFGPAHEDVVLGINFAYEEMNDTTVPEEYKIE